MITGPDLTPEQRAKSFRMKRGMALQQLVIGLVWAGVGLYEFLSGRGGTFFIVAFLVAALGFVASIVSWLQAKRYAAPPLTSPP